MRFRWFIRALFVFPILLSTFGWYWSGNHIGFIFYASDRRWAGWQTTLGEVALVGGSGSPIQDGWMHEFSRRTENLYWPLNDEDSFYGFSMRRTIGFGGTLYTWTLPYWFVMIVSAAALILVWLKTCPKYKLKPAFPIEPNPPQI